jgi:hypothetical protein
VDLLILYNHVVVHAGACSQTTSTSAPPSSDRYSFVRKLQFHRTNANHPSRRSHHRTKDRSYVPECTGLTPSFAPRHEVVTISFVPIGITNVAFVVLENGKDVVA